MGKFTDLMKMSLMVIVALLMIIGSFLVFFTNLIGFLILFAGGLIIMIYAQFKSRNVIKKAKVEAKKK